MSKIAAEQRALRLGLSTFLTSANWTGLGFSEGWDEIDITNPLVNVYVIDEGKQNLELGYQASTHKNYRRILQVDVFMETEDRVKDVCEDVMDYLDQVAVTVLDPMTTSGIGYVSFPNSESINAVFIPPSYNHPELLRWRGSVRGSFEAYYPNGGQPI